MKKPLIYFILLIIFVPSCKNKTTEHSHHNMQGMNHDTSVIENYLYDVVSPVNEIVISNQLTVKPGMRELGNIISADGYIAFDERRNNKISARFGGRVEKLFVKYNYQYVKKGEKIMELYTPEINTIQEEYIHHLTTYSDKNLIRKTREKLLLLGLTEKEISDIESTKKPLEKISVYSNYEGYILFGSDERMAKRGNSSMQSGMSMRMASAIAADEQFPASALKEGSYINKGQTLFIINDFREVWAIAAFAPTDESFIKTGHSVILLSELEDKPIKASINFIEPVYKEGQKFTQARIYLKNDNAKFKIHSFVSLQVAVGKKKLSIPSGAVLDLGERKIAWVKAGVDKFHAKIISTGIEMNGYTEIISGITERDEIAKDAGFMIDSESLISVR